MVYAVTKLLLAIGCGIFVTTIGGEALAEDMWPALFGKRLWELPIPGSFLLEPLVDDRFKFGHLFAMMSFAGVTLFSGALIETFIVHDLAQLEECPKLDPASHRVIASTIGILCLFSEAVLMYKGAVAHGGWGSDKSFDAFILTCLYMSIVFGSAYVCARIKYR